MDENVTDKPLVSVIIVNFNGRQLLEDCLSSLRKQSFRDFEVIFVDNGSLDDSLEFVRGSYGDMVRTIILPENRGFAGGNNAGIQAARGKYIALLNNDTETDSEWLAGLVACMESNPATGMVGSKILNYYRRDEIDNTGHLLYSDGLNRGRGRLETDCGQFDNDRQILFPSGCASLYKKEMLDGIGGFDERFFAYGDDTDIGLHGRYQGYGALYCPEAVVYHKYSGTTGGYSAQKVFYVERNRFWILIKYFPLTHILASPYFTVKRMILQAWGVMCCKGAAARMVENESLSRLVLTVLKAYASALSGLPDMIGKRRAIRRNRKITGREFKRLIKRHGISCREIALKD